LGELDIFAYGASTQKDSPRGVPGGPIKGETVDSFFAGVGYCGKCLALLGGGQLFTSGLYWLGGYTACLTQPENFTAKTVKIAKSRQHSSGQKNCRIEIFRIASSSSPGSTL